MAFQATVYRVLIASPRDVRNDRKVAAEAILDWNLRNSADRGVVFLPRTWERDVSPAMGDRPQTIINRQIVDDADLVVGIFGTRLGTPTGTDESGTAEEIGKVLGHRGGENVLLYFSSRAVNPYKLDRAEFDRLDTFKAQVRTQGIFQEYRSATDLKESLDRHLDDRARRLTGISSSGDDSQSTAPELHDRIQTLELNQRRGEAEAQADRLGPLYAGLTRRDRERKACLSLVPRSISSSPEGSKVTMDLRNEGDYPAYDVKVSIDTGAGFPSEPTASTCREVAPARSAAPKPCMATFRVSAPTTDSAGEPVKGQERTIRVRASFRDGLAQRDEAIYVLRLRNDLWAWRVEEDETSAVLSPLCRHLRPSAISSFVAQDFETGSREEGGEASSTHTTATNEDPEEDEPGLLDYAAEFEELMGAVAARMTRVGELRDDHLSRIVRHEHVPTGAGVGPEQAGRMTLVSLANLVIRMVEDVQAELARASDAIGRLGPTGKELVALLPMTNAEEVDEARDQLAQLAIARQMSELGVKQAEDQRGMLSQYKRKNRELDRAIRRWEEMFDLMTSIYEAWESAVGEVQRAFINRLHVVTRDD